MSGPNFGAGSGPAHLLELQEEPGLPPAQAAAIEAVVAALRDGAIAGDAAQAALEATVAAGDPTRARLRAPEDAAAAARAERRFVQRSRHLEPPMQMTPAQIARHRTLHGYGDAACAKVPEGRDPEL